MPSFDVVSKIDMQELDNGLNQAAKEIASRYDFRNTSTSVELMADKKTLLVKANSAPKIEAATEVLLAKLAKRGVSLNSIEFGKIEPIAGQHVKQALTLIQGIETEKAKTLVKAIKDSKLKVTASIQGDTLRVTGKNKDDLQEAMQLLRGQQEAIKLDLQFNNFRD